MSLISELAAGLRCVHAPYLIDEQGRCRRHPEPKPWCLECRCIATMSAALRGEAPLTSFESKRLVDGRGVG